ncbi:hypothetical protein J8281_06025 [Aquimarina sp. U1-2]|uniref:DUF6252 family protein n=1 Tax=Aquimarina sp. U1-2 TaxID=2823141 RepID=UPI001AECB548|nr:DUF6252 family protein [Aquimarina sp. U1-2]MBP2831741.1 hypothetical protein [Aquimarina sp. U1-2]
MIKITTQLLAIYCLIFTSCSTDVEINDPSLQAKIDGQLFRSLSKKAVLYDDGTLVISGSEGDKSISFTLSTTKTGSYKIGQETLSQVSFQKEQTKFVAQQGETVGEVNITEIHNNEISGNFYFENLKNNNGSTSNFQNGWFYRLPIEIGVIEEVTTQEINPCLLNASLTATVDGFEMVTDDHSARLFGVDDASILIKANTDEDEIEIVFPSNVAAGEYSLTGSGDYSATYSERKDKSSVVSGSLVITQHDLASKCISGTFEFETRSGAQITEGIFDFGY